MKRGYQPKTVKKFSSFLARLPLYSINKHGDFSADAISSAFLMDFACSLIQIAKTFAFPSSKQSRGETFKAMIR